MRLLLLVAALLAVPSCRSRSVNLNASSVACVGDSLTYGSTWVSTQYVQAAVPYPARIALDRPSLSVVNYGIGGYTTAQMLDRWRAVVRPTNAGVLVLWGGINDIFHDVPVATIQANLAAMVAEARSDGRAVILCTLAPWAGLTWPPPADWNATRQAATDAVNAWVRAQATTGVRICDLYASALNDGAGRLAAPYDDSEHLHLSPAGYDYVATLVEAALSLPLAIALTDVAPTLALAPQTYSPPFRLTQAAPALLFYPRLPAPSLSAESGCFRTAFGEPVAVRFFNGSLWVNAPISLL